MQETLLKGCLEGTVRYDSRSIKVQWQCQKYYTAWLEAPLIVMPYASACQAYM